MKDAVRSMLFLTIVLPGPAWRSHKTLGFLAVISASVRNSFGSPG
jgi:hypothetical protein